MVSEEKNRMPKMLRDYLNYNINLNKSNATITEYKYDLINFLKYMKAISTSSKIKNFDKINISDIDSKFISRIDSSDIY